MSRYQDSFWNAEFGNFSGFDTLHRHMQNGRQMLKTYVDFLKQRSLVQKAYGLALVKLVHSTSCKGEIGSLKSSWTSLLTQTEAIGMAHMVTASSIMNEADCMTNVLVWQREQRKSTEDNVRKSQANLSLYFKKAMDFKKSFDAKSREKETLVQQSSEPRFNGNIKEMEKLQLKQGKACQAFDQAELSCKISLENVEDARCQWERETEEAYNRFQMLEEQRINCLRNSMWLLSNLGSSICVQEDEELEKLRTTLEACSFKADIEEFVWAKRTGNTRPPMIDIQDCVKKMPEHCYSSSITLNYRPQLFTRGSQKRNGANAEVNGVPEICVANVNGIYESIDDMAIYAEPKIYYKVCQNYERQGPGELSLQPNEVVQVIFKKSETWWEVETKDGVKGYFPARNLEVHKK